METHKFIVPKKGTTRWELFSGYGYTEMKWSVLGAVVGIVVLLVVVGIQTLFFPYKEVELDTLQYGAKYVKTVTTGIDGIVLVERKVSSITKTAIVLFFGALFTFPNLKMNAHYTWREIMKQKKIFDSSQQLFYFKKSKWY